MRRLVDDEREGELAELPLPVVDERVVGDDPGAEADVALGEGARRLSDRSVDQLAHVGDDPPEVGEFLDERGSVGVQQWLAHRSLL